MQPGFERALYSPKVRAQKTAELAAERWSDSQRAMLEACDALAGGFDAAAALDLCAGLGADGHLLLVGHEPDLSSVVAELTGARADIKKGGLAIVRLEGAGGELVALLRPRDLALFSGIPGGGD
jgi:phosphohistidine phosphatase